MHIPTHRLLASLFLVGGANLLTAGCGRQDAPAAVVMAPATTSVKTDIDDSVLSTRIKAALYNDTETKAFDIKVESRKGVVQLSGYVDNRSQADRALAIARGTDGAISVDDNMTLKVGKETVGNQLDDTVLTARVRAALLADASIKSFDIGVATRKGEVQLSGFVDNQTQIDRALSVARGVQDVSSVINQVAIKK